MYIIHSTSTATVHWLIYTYMTIVLRQCRSHRHGTSAWNKMWSQWFWLFVPERLVWVFVQLLLWELSCNTKKKKQTELCVVDKKGEWKMARLVLTNRKATVTQITTLYNCGEQKKHLRMHNKSNLKVDALLQQKTQERSGSSFINPRSESWGCSWHRLPKTVKDLKNAVLPNES